LAYLWLPAHDYNPPSVEQFFVGVDFIDQLVRNRIKTYIHCNVGYGRAPTLLTAYLVAVRGYTLIKAVTLLSHKRPGVHPNPGQIEGIKKFIKAFKRFRKSRFKIVI
jgi:protein-tyrosine phosphatase